MIIKLLILTSFAFADNAAVSKVPSGVAPTPTPCVETGAKGEEKCKIPLAPSVNAEPKLELPAPHPNAKRVRETPRTKKK